MTKYNEDSIQVLQGLEGILRKPAMYIGELGDHAIFHLLRETVENASDEALAGFNDYIGVKVIGGTNQEFIVVDKGRGIPVGTHKKTGQSTLTSIFTSLHSGGKFDDKSYKASRGCFTGDTRVKLLDGTNPTIEELYKRYKKDGKKFDVYSYDLEGNTAFTPRKCYNVQKTKYVTTIAEVYLDTGGIIKCTPDHPFLSFNGKYIKASKLKPGTRLRSFHFGFDTDGYEIHASRNYRAQHGRKPGEGSGDERTQRTVLYCKGHDLFGKDTHHKNGVKTDNRPVNLEVYDRGSSEHFEADRLLGKHKLFAEKNKRLRKVSSANMLSLNSRADTQELALAGRIIQCCARALRDYKVLNRRTYQLSRGWCYPNFDTVLFYYDLKELVIEAKKYLKQYGSRGKVYNGGYGLNYKLLSEYDRSPVDNINSGRGLNHQVLKVKIVKLPKAIPVYDLSVESDHNYLLSAGVFVHNTHGVGLSALTALSEFVEVYTCRDEVWYYQRFSKLKPEADVEECSFPAKLVKGLGASRTQGTIIYWKPNYKVLGKTAKVTDETLDSWLFDIAYLNTKLKVVLKTDNTEETYYNKGGPKEFLANIVEDLEVETIGKPFVFEDERLTLAIQWSNYDEEDGIVSYVNNSHTEFGGTHILGLHDVLTKTFKTQALAKHDYTAQDLRQGIVGFINYKLSGAEFSSQTKERLVTNKAKQEVSELLVKPLTTWLNQNKSTARAILDRATSIHTAKEQARELTKAASSIKQSRKSLLPGKLMSSHPSTPISKRELFIVEGLSAAGTVRKARDSKFQEVLSLRGKPLNVAKTNLKRVLENKEVVDILSSIGFSETDFKALAQGKRVTPNYRIGKIMMLSDSDVDGPLHPNTRVLTLDGTNPTIKELADKWSKDNEPTWVYSINSEGELVPAQAIKPRITTYSKKMYKVHLDDGTVLNCTASHKWVVNNPSLRDNRIIWSGGLGYVRADELVRGDSLNSVYFKTGNADGDPTTNNHKVVKIQTVEFEDKKPFYCLTVPEYGNFMVADKNGNGVLSSNCHIAQLLITVFFMLCPDLIQKGMLYQVNAPLFVASYKENKWYANSLAELKKKCNKNSVITRLKGWGEADWKDMQNFAFNENRSLTQITMVKGKDAQLFMKIVGEDSATRKEILGID